MSPAHEPLAGDAGWLVAETGAGRVAVDPAIGNILHLELIDEGHRLAPLHYAPWLSEPEIQADGSLLPVERQLSGDFLCAPFGASDVEDAPAHGWPANSRWDPLPAPSGSVAAALARSVMGARITKRLTITPDAPILYQEHWIDGGAGGLTVAHHPMIRAARGGRFSTSPKRLSLSPAEPLEPARAALAYPAESRDISLFPGSDGPVDLTRLPIGTGTEDFVTLVEAPGRALGWSAVVREGEDDIVFVLKNPRVLPVTMLWHSNGGRDYAPWNGRHTAVLGIEDGCAAGAAGHAAALRANPISATGVATTLALAPGRTHRIAHVIGAIARPAGWERVAEIAIVDDALLLTAEDGATRALPFDATFLGRTDRHGNS